MVWAVCLNSNFAFLQILYEFAFAKSSIAAPFGIFTTVPRCLLGVDQTLGSVQGLLNVEEGEGLFDPLTINVRDATCVY